MGPHHQELETAARIRNLAARKILVVDDDQAVRELLAEALSRSGYNVDALASAQEALELLESSKYDLVLLDARMPEMDGIEFFHILRQRQPNLAARVIFMTGDTANANTLQSLSCTQRTILSKPFDVDTLKGAVSAGLATSSSSGTGDLGPPNTGGFLS